MDMEAVRTDIEWIKDALRDIAEKLDAAGPRCATCRREIDERIDAARTWMYVGVIGALSSLCVGLIVNSVAKAVM